MAPVGVTETSVNLQAGEAIGGDSDISENEGGAPVHTHDIKEHDAHTENRVLMSARLAGCACSSAE